MLKNKMESHREQQIRQALAAALVFKVLSFKRSLKQVLKGVNPMSIVLAALAALMYGCGDFAGGTASRKNPLLSVVLFSQIIGVAAALAVIPFLGVKSPAPSDLVFGSLSGIFGTLGLLALYEGIAKTPVAVVSPFSAVIGALLPMAFGLISGENPSPVMWIGSAVCIPAVILLSWEKSGAVGSGEIKKGLLYGMIAGAGFGGFFIAISRTAPEAGLWPLVAARSTSIFFVLIFSLVRRNLAKPERSSLWIIIFAGLLDMGANIAFMLAARTGMLIIVSVITALFPAPTVVLARIFFAEKMGKFRIAGLALALAGIACISAG